MSIVPISSTLTNGQSVQFSLTDATGAPIAVVAGGAPATWAVNPGVGAGAIDANGVYTAPGQVTTPTTASVTGTASGPNGQVATATVHLVPPEVIIMPAKVDLRAGEGQLFSVTVPGDAMNGVTWNVAPTIGGMVNGRYAAPDKVVEDREIQITATSLIDPHKSSTAIVNLRSKPLATGWTIGLFLYLVCVFGLVVVLTSMWPPALPDGSSTDKAETARVTADAAALEARHEEQKALAALRDAQTQFKNSPGDPATKKKAEDAEAAAEKATDVREKSETDATVALENQKRLEDPPVHVRYIGDISREIDLLWLVLITGALGSFVYSARSFVDFVGNKAIRGSWSAWYLMYPLIGSALALIFYLVIRGGFLTASTTGASVNIYGLVAISGMVGMFSKQATNKLDELFSTLFKSEKDDQDLKDKLKS
jgi:hypothetical protein